MSLFKRIDKRKMLVSALMSTLLILALAGSLLVNSANANPVGLYIPSPHYPPPKPDIKATLDDRNHTLTIFALTREWRNSEGTASFRFSHSPLQIWVDDHLWKTVPFRTAHQVSVSLENLKDGWHTVEVTATTSTYKPGYGSSGSSGVIPFFIDVSAPTVHVLSPEKEAYGSPDVRLSFSLNEVTSRIAYSLDGNDRVLVSGNTTLTGLPSGLHNVTVYAWDEVDNLGSSQPVTFTIVETQAQASSAITVDAIAIIASAAAISFGLAVYFVKGSRKRRIT